MQHIPLHTLFFNSLDQQTTCCFDVYLSCVRKYIAKTEAKSDTLVEYFQGILPQRRVGYVEHLSNDWMYMDAWQCVMP